jgi:hypothetical protein
MHPWALSSPVQSCLPFRAILKEGSKIMDIYRDLNQLQTDIALISPKDKPSENNKIARLFAAATGLDKEYSNLVI